MALVAPVVRRRRATLKEPARGGARYLRRIVAVPDPEYGFGPAARVGAGLMVFPTGATFGPRQQTAYELILVNSGSLVIEIDDSRRTPLGEATRHATIVLQPGEITVLVPGLRCTFRFSPLGETRVSFVSAYDPALPLSLLERLDIPTAPLLASQAITQLIGAVLSLPDQGIIPAPAPVLAASPIWLGTASVALYLDEARAAGLVAGQPAAREHPAVAAAREVVRLRLGEPIGLREMADAAHVAPEHLVRLFRRRLGTTPVRYLWSARVRLGVHLLEHTDLPVAEIATRVGCQSPKHFTRLVRADFGLPPREIRRALWSQPAARVA